jgi:hypothetical protein
MNTLIVHNDARYGGAGFPWDAAASVSVNANSPQIAIHELGHSLFGLGDEYITGWGNPEEDPNCDRSGCSKWADLIGRWGVGCKPGKCQNGAWYGAEDTMMEGFNWRFGEVNERISCCKYLYHTSQIPAFCSKFNEGGLDLLRYCDSDIWKGRYTQLGLLQSASGSRAPLDHAAGDPQGTSFVHVEHPVAWTLRPAGLEGSREQWTCVPSEEQLEHGLYLRERVEGDDVLSKDKFAGSGRVVVEVLADEMGRVDRTIAFFAESPIEVPFSPEEDDRDGRQLVISERRSSISLVLRKGEGCRFRETSDLDGKAQARIE